MLDIGIQELLVIMVLALLIFGPDKLPELGRRLGRAMREFRRASDEFRSTVEQNLQLNADLDASPPSTSPAAPEAVTASADAVTTDAERRTALAALVAFSTARWADSGGTTAFGSPQLRAFHESATAAAFDDGTLRVYVLTLNGGIAAVLYGFVLSRRFYFYQHGFDPGLAARSIGVALMALTIKAAIDEGLDVTLEEGLRIEQERFVQSFTTPDAAVGVRSFLAEGPGKAVFD